MSASPAADAGGGIAVISNADQLVLIDAHAHFHACAAPAEYLQAAVQNFRAAARKLAASSRPRWVGILLLADIASQDSVAAVQADAAQPDGLKLQVCDVDGGCLVFRNEEAQLVLMSGQQLVSREGIEVLSLATPIRLPERLPLEQYPGMVQEARGLCVLPWGFGKWWSRRGHCVRQTLDRFAQERRIFLGDNGLRPALVPAPRMFRHAQIDWPILPGSDPLPFASHIERIASFGLALEAMPDLGQPGMWIRETLQRSTASWRSYGRATTIPRFLADQLSLQLRKVAAV